MWRPMTSVLASFCENVRHVLAVRGACHAVRGLDVRHRRQHPDLFTTGVEANTFTSFPAKR